MYVLFDAIDLMRLVQGTLKVQGKSLATVLDEVQYNCFDFSANSMFSFDEF